jgi:hypothetical protein
MIQADYLNTIHIPYHFSGGWGVATEREGGFSGLNTKPDTDGQPYLTIPYTSQGFQIIISNWMRAILGVFLQENKNFA